MNERRKLMIVVFAAAVVTGLAAGADHPIEAPGILQKSSEEVAIGQIQLERICDRRGSDTCNDRVRYYNGPVAEAVPGTLAELSGSPDMPCIVSSDAWRHANRVRAYIEMPLVVYPP